MPFEDGLGGEPLEMDILLNDHRAAMLPAATLPRLQGRCDLFVNVKSFQEMEPDVVTNYVTVVRQFFPRWALMLNSRDGIFPDALRGKPGTRECVTVASTVLAFGTACRVESPWLDWRHSDNNQELTVLEFRHVQ